MVIVRLRVTYGRRLVSSALVLWVRTLGDSAFLLLRMHRAIVGALLAIMLVVLVNNICHVVIAEFAIIELIAGNSAVQIMLLRLDAVIADSITW